MFKRFLTIAIFLYSVPCFASDATVVSDICRPTLSTAILSGVALNGTAATRTIKLSGGTTALACPRPLSAYNRLTIYTAYTHANNGALTWTCKGGDSLSSAVYTLTTCTTSSGTCTLNDGGVLVTVSLSADKFFESGPIKVHDPAIVCTIAHGGTPDGSDKVSAFVILTTN